MRLNWFRNLALIASVLLPASCTPGEGDPCKEDDDCSGSLVCCKESSIATLRGVCEMTCGDDMISSDSGASDGALDDGGDVVDGAAPTDSGS